MYCKNCGNQVNENAIACLKCGCDPKRGANNCNSCGVETTSEQIICIKCGVALKTQNSASTSLSSTDGKSTAIIAYLTLIGFIIAAVQHSSDKTKLAAYHLRQSAGLFVTLISLYILLLLLALPMAGMTDYKTISNYLVFHSLISLVCWITLLVCWIISLVNATAGKEKPAPIFGKSYENWFSNFFN
mgnify:FL=1